MQYLAIDSDDTYLTGEGVQLRGFWNFSEFGLLYASAGSNKITQRYGGSRFQLTSELVSIGLGGRTAVTENIDFFGVGGGSSVSVDSGLGDTSDTTGYFLALGFRTLIAERLDLTIAGEYSDFDGIDDTSFGVEARYWLGERFAVSFSVSPDSDVNTLGIGFSFAL